MESITTSYKSQRSQITIKHVLHQTLPSYFFRLLTPLSAIHIV